MCSFRVAESSDFEPMGSGGQQTKHELAATVGAHARAGACQRKDGVVQGTVLHIENCSTRGR